MKHIMRWGTLILLNVFILSACSSNPPTPTQISTSSPFPSSTITLTSTPTATFTPTPTITVIPDQIESQKLPLLYAGIRILYNDNSKIWVWQDGLSKAITNMGLYTTSIFSQDGSRIVFTRDGELFEINSDGSNEHVLIAQKDMAFITPNDPNKTIKLFGVKDKSVIVIAIYKLGNFGWEFDGQLFIVDIVTGKWQKIYQNEEGGRFGISPNGELIAVSSSNRIMLMNLDGSNQRTVLQYEPHTWTSHSYYPIPEWSTDSKFMIAEVRSENKQSTVIFPGYPLYDDALITLWQVPVSGTPTKIFETTQYKVNQFNLNFSPNLSKFAYVEQESDKNDRLHVFSMENFAEIFSYASMVDSKYTAIYIFSWSQDSKSLLFEDTQNGRKWIRLGETKPMSIALPKVNPPYLQMPLWLDEDHFVVVTLTREGLWITTSENETIQVAVLHRTEVDDLFFPGGFDFVLTGPN